MRILRHSRLSNMPKIIQTLAGFKLKQSALKSFILTTNAILFFTIQAENKKITLEPYDYQTTTKNPEDAEHKEIYITSV